MKSNIKKSFINGAGAEIRTRVPGSTVPEDDRLPYPGIDKLDKKLLKCGSRDLNPGRPASTGPKPVPFGLSGTPAYKNKGYIETIKNLNKFLKCSGRDSNPSLRLERPKRLAGLHHRSIQIQINFFC